MTPIQNTIFQLLCAAAEAGKPCPTNGELADQADLMQNNRASEIVGELERLGRIKVQRKSNSRVVTILATGAQTSAKSGTAKPRRYEKATAAEDRFIQRPPDRSPCFRCGTRGDVGCSHQPQSTAQVPISMPPLRSIARGSVDQSERERILQLSREGLNFTAIASVVARPRSTVWYILRNAADA